MNDQNQNEKETASRRWGRGCLPWLGAGLASLPGLMLVGSLMLDWVIGEQGEGLFNQKNQIMTSV